MSANCLKRFPLPSMTGLPAMAPMLPSPSTAVPLVTTRDEVALGGVLVGEVRVALDLEARLGDARRVGERQVPLVGERLGRNDRDLSRPSLRVVVERVLSFGHEGPEK